MLRKTLLPLLIAALSTISLNAQTEMGTFSIGVNTGPGLRYSKNMSFKGLLLNGDLRAGYFIKNNLLIGGEYGLSHLSLTQNGDEYASSKGFHTGLFARKYFDLKNPKWKPFIELGSGFNHADFKYKNQDATFTNATRNLGYLRAEAGIAYFINNKTSLNLSYAHQWNFGKDTFHANSGLKFGIHYNFNGKKK